MSMSLRDVMPGVINMVQCDVRLDGKTVIITGANSGIGYETALDLAGRGAKVIMACRDIPKAEEAKQKILEEVKDAEWIIRKLDLASLASVRAFAKGIIESEDRLDILINNAGIMLAPPGKTEDGFEMHLGVNHIGHFLLTNLLLDLLKKSAPSRIVILASLAHTYGKMEWNDMMQEKNYNAFFAYSSSKLANLLHCKELSKRLEGTGVTCYAIHPGVVKTELFRYMNDVTHFGFFWRMLMRLVLALDWFMPYLTAKQGAQTTIYCAITPELSNVSGKYYTNCAEATVLNKAGDQDAERLWTLSEKWTEKKSDKKDENEEMTAMNKAMLVNKL